MISRAGGPASTQVWVNLSGKLRCLLPGSREHWVNGGKGTQSHELYVYVILSRNKMVEFMSALFYLLGLCSSINAHMGIAFFPSHLLFSGVNFCTLVFKSQIIKGEVRVR